MLRKYVSGQFTFSSCLNLSTPISMAVQYLGILVTLRYGNETTPLF